MQEMCDKALDTCLLALKLVFDWFVGNKVIQKLDNSVFSNDAIVFGYVVSDIIAFFNSDIGLHIVNLNNINLDDVVISKTINHVTLMTWYNRLKQHKGYKK